MHKKVLTWENLRRKGFTGPSSFPLYQEDKETPNHLLNVCPFASNVWNWLSLVFQISDRDPSSIQDVIVSRSMLLIFALMSSSWM